jgi:uncharacterized protein YdeI (YjbR/CyaY-like superfamily)
VLISATDAVTCSGIVQLSAQQPCFCTAYESIVLLLLVWCFKMHCALSISKHQTSSNSAITTQQHTTYHNTPRNINCDIYDC